MKKSLKIEVLALIAILLVMVATAYGGVPQLINYQGTLNSKSGAPVSGTFNVGFRIYSTATGSTPLWTENWSSTSTPPNPITATNGSFNVMLGSLTPFPADFFVTNPKTYLGITVGSDSEMTPRQPIASVAYALSAGSSIPKGGIIMWSGAVNQVPDGWALCDGANGTPDLRDRFVVGAGSTYVVGASGGNSTINIQHSHNVNDHTHSITITSAGAHNHGGATAGPNSTKSVGKSPSDSVVPDSGHTHNISQEPAHTHPASASTTTNLTTQNALNSPVDVRPPYYALAFIMKQ